MNKAIKYELWKNEVIQRAKALYGAAKGIGINGLEAIDEYHDRHKKLWEVLDREPPP